MSLLSVRDLTIATDITPTHTLVDHVGFDVPRDTIVGVVGESGSGKSLTSLAIMGLAPRGVRVVAGSATFDGMQLEVDGEHRLEGAAMVFQNARAALNPTMRVAKQISRAARLGAGDGSPREVAAALRGVGIDDPDRVGRAYPHQLSGGMCQRVMLAVALATKPKLLIADEPTTGLDVTVQAQILLLLRDAARSAGCSVLLITHDLGVVAQVCDELVVMQGGQVRETGSTVDVFERPADDYTRALLATIDAPIGAAPSAVPGD